MKQPNIRPRYPNPSLAVEELGLDFVLSHLSNPSRMEDWIPDAAPSVSPYRLRYVMPDLPSADEILPYLRQIDANRWYSNFGPLEQAFREGLAKRFFPDVSAEHIITASSGALAIETALIAHNFPLGARILMPSLTFVATAAAVVRAGCVPIFADVDPDSLALNADRAGYLARILGCSAVVPVGVAGIGLPIADWDSFAQDTGMGVIIDAAGSLGNQKISPYITLAFSLHATKPLGVGEGGLVVSTRREILAKARVATNFGLDEGRGVICGTNAKMSEYHAAVGLAQLNRLHTIQARRKVVLETYGQMLSPLAPQIKMLTPVKSNPANLIISFHRPVVNKVVTRLSSAGIESRRLYLPPVHRHPAYVGYSCAEPLVQSEHLWAHSLSLPCHGSMSQRDVEEIVSLVAEAVR